MIRIHDRAVVLRRTPFRETSLVVHFYTQRHGLLSALARGVRGGGKGGRGGRQGEQRAALAGFHTLVIDRQARSIDGLGTLTGVETVTTRHHLLNDAGALATAQLLQEVVFRFMAPGDPRPEIFERLEWALDALESRQEPLAVTVFSLARLLRDLGYGWRVDRCAGCGGRDALSFFSVRRGQAVCEPCGRPYADRLDRLSENGRLAMERLEWWNGFGLLSRQEKITLYHLVITGLGRLDGRPLLSDRSFRRMAGLGGPDIEPLVARGANG